MSTKVTLTLAPYAAERLRRMCHARNVTASDLIYAWIAQHDDAGNLKEPPAPPRDPARDFANDAIARFRAVASGIGKR